MVFRLNFPLFRLNSAKIPSFWGFLGGFGAKMGSFGGHPGSYTKATGWFREMATGPEPKGDKFNTPTRKR